MNIIYKKDHNLNLINEEIMDAFPQWKGILNSEGIYENQGVFVRGDGSALQLTVPNDADTDALDAVINAHDATKKSNGEKEKQNKEDSKKEYDKYKFKDIAELDSIIDKEFSSFTNKQKDFLKQLGRLCYYIGSLEVKKEY